MHDFLALTLAGTHPDKTKGDTVTFSWRWHGEGLLELTPHQPVDRAMVLSVGIHGNETAPVEIVDDLLAALFTGSLALRWRILVILGNPDALRTHQRYLHVDLNRLFGQRWQNYPPSLETKRAEQLEQAVDRFGMKHSCTGWKGRGWRRWSFTSRRAAPLPILAASALTPWPAPLS